MHAPIDGHAIPRALIQQRISETILCYGRFRNAAGQRACTLRRQRGQRCKHPENACREGEQENAERGAAEAQRKEAAAKKKARSRKGQRA